MWSSVGITSCVLYSFLLVANAVSYALYLARSPTWTHISVEHIFHGFIGTFCLVRISWAIVQEEDVANIVDYILNRVGYCLFFTAFTVILAWWVEQYRKTYIDTERFLPVTKVPWLLTNLVFYIFFAIMIVLNVVDVIAGDQREDQWLYNVEVFTFAAVNFGIALLFLIYGSRTFVRQKLSSDSSMESKKALIAMLVSTLLITISFFVRMIMLTYRPLTGQYMNNVVYATFAYWVPELLPSLLQIYTLGRQVKKRVERKRNIEHLYNVEDEDAEESAIADDSGARSYFTMSDESQSYDNFVRKSIIDSAYDDDD
eukprot:TRINITY_DN16421_c0_g1_i1.p1 TRINITY_DN16421_c0_g1~~TRINITY_DN16421_c0_g1_i1.p1  ORF type:complete len:314 (+),score=92.38 TRINITY_DN16421_c0_g1_i1:130-1071(+)